MGENIISTKKKWEDWAIKLQAISQAGLYYTKNEFERERYREIRNIACEILAEHSYININKIEEYFTNETGYKTPKIDSRAVCFKDSKILLAQEKSGQWAIPGGWTDIDKTISENVVKEALEEAGAVVEPMFIICLHDWKKHISIEFKQLPFQICKVFIMCKLHSMKFCANSETLQADFFSLENLPKLALAKNSLDQISTCFDAYNAYKNEQPWIPKFD